MLAFYSNGFSSNNACILFNTGHSGVSPRSIQRTKNKSSISSFAEQWINKNGKDIQNNMIIGIAWKLWQITRENLLVSFRLLCTWDFRKVFACNNSISPKYFNMFVHLFVCVCFFFLMSSVLTGKRNFNNNTEAYLSNSTILLQ